MSKLTSSNIETVTDARISGNDNQLEFKIYPSGENGARWVHSNRIATQTLRSKKFQTFYKTKGADVHNVNDLKQFLIESQQEQQQEPAAANLNNDDQVVKIEIGEETQEFSVSQLESLSYFNAMFSQRWLNNHNNNPGTIDLFGNNINNNFEFEHLEWLLKCVEIKSIPYNLPLNVQLLEGLINCNDFLMNKQDSIVTVDNLIEYFKNVDPRPSLHKKRELLQQANNEVLKQALTTLENELKNSIKGIRAKLANNHSNIESIDKIGFDRQTAFEILEKKLKLRIVEDKTNGILKIEVIDFTNVEDYIKLAKKCCPDCFSRLRQFIELIDAIVKPENESLRIFVSGSGHGNRSSGNSWKMVGLLVWEIARNTNIQDCNNSNINMTKKDFEIRMVAVCKTFWKLASDYDKPLSTKFKLVDFFGDRFSTLSIDSFENFATLIFQTYQRYIRSYQSTDEMNPQRKKEFNDRLLGLVAFWKFCVLKCRRKWIANNAKLWFPIVHKHDTNSTQWIIKDIIDKMNGETAMIFALYLTDFIAYERDTKRKFPQPYLDFLTNELGITWDLQS